MVENSFVGTGWGFPPEFHQAEVKMVSEEQDIWESLNILLSTMPGERIMAPTYGCGIKSMIFEELDAGTVTLIKDLIERAILFFEPRITLNETEVDAGAYEEGIIRINLKYTIRSTNNRSNMVYPFYFKEGTNLK